MSIYTISTLRGLIQGTESYEPIVTAENASRVYVDSEVGLVIPGYDLVHSDGSDFAPEIAIRPLPSGGLEFRHRDPENTQNPMWGRVWSLPQFCENYAALVESAYSL